MLENLPLGTKLSFLAPAITTARVMSQQMIIHRMYCVMPISAVPITTAELKDS